MFTVTLQLESQTGYSFAVLVPKVAYTDTFWFPRIVTATNMACIHYKCSEIGQNSVEQNDSQIMK